MAPAERKASEHSKDAIGANDAHLSLSEEKTRSLEHLKTTQSLARLQTVGNNALDRVVAVVEGADAIQLRPADADRIDQ